MCIGLEDGKVGEGGTSVISLPFGDYRDLRPYGRSSGHLSRPPYRSTGKGLYYPAYGVHNARLCLCPRLVQILEFLQAKGSGMAMARDPGDGGDEMIFKLLWALSI